MSLTDTTIRNTKPASTTRRLFDGGGMYLEIATTGSKWFRLKYRINGKEKRISLGVYPEVSLKDAREKRDEARKLLASGIDPSQARKEDRLTQANHAANAFEAIAREWFTNQTAA